MFLTSKDIPDLHRLIHEPQLGGIGKIKGADISLSVALYLAVTYRALWLAGNTGAAGSIARLGLPGVSRAINCLMEATPTQTNDPLGAPAFDLYRINSKADLLADPWELFRARFRRSSEGGRTGKMFGSISSVFGEMGDNVVWHAFEADDRPCPAIAGFHVSNGSATFCVADAGQGFLRSLRRSKTWAGLKNDHDALVAVVEKQATSRPGEKEGSGFKLLITSMLDYNGIIVLRSGSTALHLANKGAMGNGRYCGAVHSMSPVPGSSVTAVFSQRGQPEEISLEENS